MTPDGIAGSRTLAKLRTATVPLAGKHGPSRRIEIHRAKGIALLIDRGKVTRAIHSSAGKRGFETPTGNVPAHPASHGCVRFPPGDATDVYRFATIGTAVLVH